MGGKHIQAANISSSQRRAWAPGTRMLMDQFLDVTQGSCAELLSAGGAVAHVDITEPYCPTLHSLLTREAETLHISLSPGVPFPVSAARELAMYCVTVAVVSNLASGRTPAAETVTDVSLHLMAIGNSQAKLFGVVVRSIPEPYTCCCRHTQDEAFP